MFSRPSWRGCALLAAAACLAFPVAASADAGIPMMPVRYPALLFLAPVILIEAVYLQHQLRTNWRRTAVAVAGVNICTTALGYPLAWGIFTGLQQTIGLPDHEPGVFPYLSSLPVWLCTKFYPQWTGEQIWPVLVVFLVLLYPSFIVSGVIKRWLMDWYDLLNYRGSTRQESWAANRLSYIFLAVSGCAALYLAGVR